MKYVKIILIKFLIPIHNLDSKNISMKVIECKINTFIIVVLSLSYRCLLWLKLLVMKVKLLRYNSSSTS